MFQETTALQNIAALEKKIRGIQGGTCFTAGTPILLPGNEYKNIEDIKKEDVVLSFSPNLGIIESRVNDVWENPANKPILSIIVNGETLNASYDHKFYTPTGYKELYKIVWGALETSQRIQLKLLCEQYGQDIDDNSLRGEESGDNEASGCNDSQSENTIQATQDNDGWQNHICTQGSGGNLDTESPKPSANRSPQSKLAGQPSGESTMGDSIGEHKQGIQGWLQESDDRGEEPQSKTDRYSSFRNQDRVGHNSRSNKETNSFSLWGIGSEHKGYSGVQNLSTLTAEQIQIQEPQKTFAISVENENYFVGENKINVSNSAGKTIAILLYLIGMAQTDTEKTLTSVVSESIPHLKRGALRDFKNIMQAHRYWKDKNWNATDSIYTFETGSQIEFFSSDNGDKLRGGRRDRCFINEANNVPLDAFDQLEVRTKEFIFLDWNPTNEFWFYTDILNHRDDCEHIIITYKDNEALSQEIINSIEARKNRTQWWKVYGLGQLGEVEGKIFTGWAQLDEIPHEARRIGRGLDFGYSNDPTAITDIYQWNGGYILDELVYRKGMSNSEIATALKDDDIITVADSAEPKSIDEIKSHGITIVPSEKGADSVNQGIQLMQDQRFWVTKHSHNLWREYMNYLWDKDKNGQSLNKPEHGFNHAIDGVRYFLQRHLRKSQHDVSEFYQRLKVQRQKRRATTKAGLR